MFTFSKNRSGFFTVAKLMRYSILFVLLIGLSSWGEKAHRKINGSSVDFFPKELYGLKGWGPILANHGSDADLRKKTDRTEFVKHFIDIDIYEDFIKKRKIEENFEAACVKYGKEKVIKNGTLPWVTDSTYKALVANFKSKNWNRAVLTAADLGHYVGDGFMPLHITANYNGQLSNQTGIHRRYEETMIDKNIDRINFKTSEINKVPDVQLCIFNYLYKNHIYADLLLRADDLSDQKTGIQYSSIYYEDLWRMTNSFTVNLLQESSKTLASLIYTAWIEAGKPMIPDIPVKR
jgi:hypothetical protein